MHSHHVNIKIAITSIFCVLLSACAEKATPGPFTSTPLAHPTATVEIQTPTNVPTPTAAKPSATSTPVPSFTPTIIQPTKTATENPNIALTDQAAEAAYEAKATKVASFPVTCEYFFNNVSISPNGTWLAVRCNNGLDRAMEVANKEGKRWVLKFKDYLSPELIRDGNIPMGGLYPAHWTSNDEYLYFTSHISFDGGGACFYDPGEQGIYRINVNTGFVSAILPPRTSWGGYTYAFSPGGGKLAFSADKTGILDFRTDEKLEIDADQDHLNDVGDLTWSPDGSKLAFATCRRSEDGASTVQSTVKIYDLETRELKTVFEVKKTSLYVDMEDGNQRFRISNYDIETNRTEYLYYDWSSGQLITPTPN